MQAEPSPAPVLNEKRLARRRLTLMKDDLLSKQEIAVLRYPLNDTDPITVQILGIYSALYVGFIHQVVLFNYLDKHPEPEDIEYYLCGPPLMPSAVQKTLDDLGVPKNNIAFDDFGS